MPSAAVVVRPLRLLVVAAVASVGLAALEQYPLNFCTTYTNLCSAFQQTVFCPEPVNQVNCEGPVAATNHPTYTSYAGRCECGALNATRLEQQIVFHEIGRQQAQQNLLVANADGTTDFCASCTSMAYWMVYVYQPLYPMPTQPPPPHPKTDTNTCNAFLTAVACPAGQQVNQGCAQPGDFSSFANQCLCGNIDGSLEARNSIIQYLELPKVHSLTSYAKESEVVELCPTFKAICGSFLDDIACPAADRTNVGCTRGNDYGTYQGKCMCGQVDAGDRVRRLVIDAHIGDKISMISDSFINTDGTHRQADRARRRKADFHHAHSLSFLMHHAGTLDLCNTFSWSCSAWLDDTIQVRRRTSACVCVRTPSPHLSSLLSTHTQTVPGAPQAKRERVRHGLRHGSAGLQACLHVWGHCGPPTHPGTYVMYEPAPA